MTTSLTVPAFHSTTAAMDVRRTILRALAEQIEQFTPADVRRAVATWTPGLPTDIRQQTWDDLVLDINRLADLGAGLEWRDIAPGAPPSQGYTIATEVLEQDIATHLDTLLGLQPVCRRCGGSGVLVDCPNDRTCSHTADRERPCRNRSHDPRPTA